MDLRTLLSRWLGTLSNPPCRVMPISRHLRSDGSSMWDQLSQGGGRVDGSHELASASSVHIMSASTPSSHTISASPASTPSLSLSILVRPFASCT